MLCVICHELILSGQGKAFSCGHVFHIACSEAWLRKKPTCPSCRMEIDREIPEIDDGNTVSLPTTDLTSAQSIILYTTDDEDSPTKLQERLRRRQRVALATILGECEERVAALGGTMSSTSSYEFLDHEQKNVLLASYEREIAEWHKKCLAAERKNEELQELTVQRECTWQLEKEALQARIRLLKSLNFETTTPPLPHLREPTTAGRRRLRADLQVAQPLPPQPGPSASSEARRSTLAVRPAVTQTVTSVVRARTAASRRMSDASGRTLGAQQGAGAGAPQQAVPRTVASSAYGPGTSAAAHP